MLNKQIIYCSSGIIFGGLFFVIHDAIINHLSYLNFKFYHHIVFGSPWMFLLFIYLLLSGNFKKHLSSSNYTILIIRGAIFLPIPFILFVSLQNISLAEWTTLHMISPILGMILAIIFLKEKINLFTVISIILGFTGVLFILQPGFNNFNIYYLGPLFGAFTLALQSFLANKFNNICSTLGFFIYGLLPVNVLSFILFYNDPLIDFELVKLSLFANFIVLIGMYFFTYALQNSQKHFSSVFGLLYLQIFWSFIISAFFFNENINIIVISGAIFIIISGLLSLHAQKKQLNDY
tara:strand:- start:278 stop:1153 length:876 start_codon:yes stop_codon:yes gene_type:complete